jgi:hypothetical protein
MLRAAAGDENTVASDAFVYFDAANPERKLAPDGLVKLDVPQHEFESWKAWRRGTPELAFEILSPSDSPERWTFEEKLVRYRALGVEELIVFHADGKPGSRLRAWDRIDDDLVERVVEAEKTPCLILDAFLVVAPIEDLPPCVRLARDPDGKDLFLTAEEGRMAAEEGRMAAEAARRAADAEREAANQRTSVAEEKLREAERRLAELEAQARKA